MNCTTVKAGVECAFMNKAGCGYSGGSCHTIVEQCEGCQRVTDFAAGKYCNSYPNPSSRWRTSACNLATHVKAESQGQQQKVNPLKASKRATKRK